MEDQKKSNRGNQESSSSAEGWYYELNVENMTCSLKKGTPPQQKMNSRDDSGGRLDKNQIASAPSLGLTAFNPMPLPFLPRYCIPMPLPPLPRYANPMPLSLPRAPSQGSKVYNPTPLPLPRAPSQPIPEASGRKKIADAKEKMAETARKEQFDRIAKVAAPSDLPSWPEPGIIRDPRIRKQVLAFLEAMARPRKKRKRGDHTEREAPLDINSPQMEETRINTPLECDLQLKLALPHSDAGCSTSYLSNEESGNLTSLSTKAANIATKWLELMIQDTSGRLAAVRSSKERAKATVQSTAKEISSNPDCSSESCGVKWITVFQEVQKSLCEEEVELEKWLNQLTQIQRHIEMAPQGEEKVLAVRAAAAALYSMCKFVENRP